MAATHHSILVVEDEPMLLQNISSILEMMGYFVLKATNGNEGFETANTHLPELIICDVMMDGMNGFELLEKIKQQPKLANIPFVFLSARADINDKQMGINGGANAYLTKPFQVKELLNTVQKFIQ